MKVRLKAEGSELPTNCSQLKLKAVDGKRRATDVANTEQLLRIIQSMRHLCSADTPGERYTAIRKAPAA
jgi:hypothetical protein